MTEKKTRRGRGEGGLFWDEARQRFVAEVTVGYTPAGKRIVRRGSGKTKTEARNKLKQVIRDHEDGLPPVLPRFTVGAAVEDFLTFGLGTATDDTRANYMILAGTNIVPRLGARKLKDLSATDVDRWLAQMAATLSTRTVRLLYSILNRSVRRAMARDQVRRNVVELCSVPTGQVGRPSKSLTFLQAKAVLIAAERSWLLAYIVVSLMTGARTEELRALDTDHVDLDGDGTDVPPSIDVWHSVRVGGDTKTRKSRRTLALPRRAVIALRHQEQQQLEYQDAAGKKWTKSNLVFTTRLGTPLDPHNVRREFRKVISAAGLDPAEWTPRELRHSFVSLLSDDGMSIEEIADLCGHAGPAITGAVYRHQLRPVLLNGAVAMDQIFADEGTENAS
jgi:integrase